MDQAHRPAAPDSGAGHPLSAPDAPGRLTFRFLQFEFPWALGPPDGRYVMRAPAASGARPAPSHVVVLGTQGAPERRMLSRTRSERRGAAPEPPPEPVTTGRATVVDAVQCDDSEAAAWLATCRDASAATEALALLNGVIHAHRVAAADPAIHDVSVRQALVVRAGYGDGQEVAEGRWTEAVELARQRREPRVRRGDAALRAGERFAALLGGLDRSLVCEHLALRAREDLDAGRVTEALTTLDAGLRAAQRELPLVSENADVRRRVHELGELAPGISAAAADALGAPALAPHAVGEAPEVLTHALGRLEAALRARSATGSWAADR